MPGIPPFAQASLGKIGPLRFEQEKLTTPISIRDSAIAQISLSRIGLGGLTQADAQNNNMRICTFRQDPNFSWMFEQAWKSPHMVSSFLCIPGPEVSMLNAVIVRINPKDKMAQLIPLQITTALTCVDLAMRFFAVLWHKWERAIQEEGFKVRKFSSFTRLGNLGNGKGSEYVCVR